MGGPRDADEGIQNVSSASVFIELKKNLEKTRQIVCMNAHSIGWAVTATECRNQCKFIRWWFKPMCFHGDTTFGVVFSVVFHPVSAGSMSVGGNEKEGRKSDAVTLFRS